MGFGRFLVPFSAVVIKIAHRTPSALKAREEMQTPSTGSTVAATSGSLCNILMTMSARWYCLVFHFGTIHSREQTRSPNMSFQAVYEKGGSEEKCLRCTKQFTKKQLKIGYSFGSADKEVWFHLDCFKVPFALNADNLEEKMQNFEDLTKADQGKLREKVNDATPVKGKQNDKKRKRENEEMTPKKKAKSDLSEEKKEISKKTTEELRNMLRINNQLLSGKKEELVDRVHDRQKNGNVPKCPKCKIGYLHVIDDDDFELPSYKKIDNETTTDDPNNPRPKVLMECHGHREGKKYIRCPFIGHLKRTDWNDTSIVLS
jgi:hypothetical protein